MALIKCPECQVPVSDKAITCPHCGYPLDTKVIKQQQRKTNKRKRLPNGFGTISELKNQNLRKPFLHYSLLENIFMENLFINH